MATSQRRRQGLTLVAGVLGVGALAAWWFTRDPEARLVEQAVREYVGDLKTQSMASASLRVFPDDLLVLKEAALFKAGVEDSFRKETLEFFQARDLDEVRQAPRHRFCEFLLIRTFMQHRRLFDDLSRGRVAGVRVRRDGEEARAWVSVDVDLPEGRRRLTLEATLIRRDGRWWVRI